MSKDYCFNSCTKQGCIVMSIVIALLSVMLLLIAILIPVSLQQVNYDEVAIEYNTLDKSVNTNRLLKEGRYVLTPNSVLFKYKRTLQNIDMVGPYVLECLTREGLHMRLDITTQYQIDKDLIFEIFFTHGSEVQYITYLNSITRDAIKDVCPHFTGEDFFFQRARIEQAFGEELERVYNSSRAYATHELVQLRNVNHPHAYVIANQDKESVEQEKDRVLSEREEQITKATTNLVKAQFDANIKLVQAQAKASSNIIAANEQAKVEVAKWTELQGAFTNIQNQFVGVSVQDFINQYVRYYILTNRKNSTIIGLKE